MAAKKGTSVMKCVIDNGQLVWTFTDGHKLVFDPKDCSREVRERAELHGFKQKIGDAAAIEKDSAGKSASVAVKRQAMVDVKVRLLNNEWEAGPQETGGMFFEALCRTFPTKTEEQVRAWLDGRTDDEKKALTKSQRVMDHMAAIKAERAKASGMSEKGDALLDSFEFDEETEEA